MKKILIIFLILTSAQVHSQQVSTKVSKPVIDSAAIANWASVELCHVSRNSQYVSYTIDNLPVNKNTTIIKSINGNWERKIISNDFFNPIFTADSRQVIYKCRDSLVILSLGTDKADYVPNVRSFQLTWNDEDQKIIYLKSDQQEEIVIRSLRTGKETIYGNVKGYQLNTQETTALLFRREKNNSVKVQWQDLENGQTLDIWEGKNAHDFVFDKAGRQLIFMVDPEDPKEKNKSLWYYQNGGDKATLLVDQHTPGIDSNLVINPNQLTFSEDGKSIRCNLEEKAITQRRKNAVSVDVWHYKEAALQSEQLTDGLIPLNFFVVINLNGRRVIRLQNENEYLSKLSDRYGLVWSRKDLDREGSIFTTPASSSYTDLYLINLNSGKRKLLKSKVSYDPSGTYNFGSPDGKWIVYYDSKKKGYFSYEIASGTTHNISSKITTNLLDDHPYLTYNNTPVGIAGWVEENKFVLIYDSFDIWKVDPSGKHLPVNLTNGYGLKYHFRLRLVNQDGVSHGRSANYIQSSDTLLLSAFNLDTKYDGFCKKVINDNGDPVLLYSKPCYMGGANSNIEMAHEIAPKRLGKTNKWLIQQQSFNSAPNFYLTEDFKTYKQITNVQPQKTYNWLKAGLIHYPKSDGNQGTAILYKPENFDPKKKYPVIFQYYEHLSNSLYFYQDPNFASAEINIPWMVSRGYVVCVPDIVYEVGYPGESAAKCVIGAATYLSKLSWIDKQHMGINAHSFGGFETNYLITHCHLFAAAAEAAGSSDIVSQYGGFFAVFSANFYYETGQGRIGATLWQRPDLYIKNSPVFLLNKVTTPLLIMHNKGDATVPFAQGIELFTGLKRLGKKVWLLQYDNESHLIQNNYARQDFTKRLTQFFDHYLKGAPPPIWMTKGIPARMKGVDDGLELDKNEKQP